MTSSINQYLVEINTGVEYPYYNQKTYNDDKKYDGDLDDFKIPAESDYTQIFDKLIKMEQTNTPNYEETNARALCHRMLNLEKQNARVDPKELDEFKNRLDQYFAKKVWSFNNLSDLQVLRRQLAKVAVDLYERKIKQLLKIKIDSLKKYIHVMAEKMKYDDQQEAKSGKDPHSTPVYNYIQTQQVLTIQQIIHYIEITASLFDNDSSNLFHSIHENLNIIEDLLKNIPMASGFYKPTPEQVTHIKNEIGAIQRYNTNRSWRF